MHRKDCRFQVGLRRFVQCELRHRLVFRCWRRLFGSGCAMDECRVLRLCPVEPIELPCDQNPATKEGIAHVIPSTVRSQLAAGLGLLFCLPE